MYKTRLNYGWAAALSAIALSIPACGGGSDDAPATVAASAPDPAAACSALAGSKVAASEIALETKGALVKAATLVPATTSLPEYCLASGTITSVDIGAQDINFAVALPTQWNSRAMHVGGGGFDGVVPSVTSTVLVSGPSPLARGYAVFGGDSGHQAPAGEAFGTFFGLNDEMLRNYGGDSLKKTKDVAMKLVALRYKTAPQKTYFIGGSQGGHEGMQVLQRWGEEYDGIVTNYPAYGYMSQILAWNVYGRALRGGTAAGYLNPEKLKTLRAGELTACDAADGAADGVISNLGACTFTPAALRCAGGADTGDGCLSDAQITSVQTMQTRLTFPYVFNSGVTSYTGLNIGSDYAGILGLGTQAAFPVPPKPSVLGLMHGYADAIIRNFVLKDPTANTLNFDPLNPGVYAARIQEVSNFLDANTVEVQPFMKKGKWILVHGLSDQLIAPGASVDYYNRLVAKYGQAEVSRFMRFYTVPGFGHGSGPFNASGGLPTLDALEQWVEAGTVPGSLIVKDTNPGLPTTNRTRPLCEYPKWPKYSGSGDVNSAASYTCSTS